MRNRSQSYTEGSQEQSHLQAMKMLNLQEDIQVEILSRLPAKSISVCRCVCKTWKTILRNPKFVNNLLIQANNNPKLMVYKIPYARIINKPKNLVYSIDYASVLSSDHEWESNGAAIQMDYPFQGEDFTSYKVFGSYNGLFCLGTCKAEMLLWIWNPTTREYKKISVAQHVQEQHPYHFCYGFGHDGEDYKIVRITSDEPGPAACFNLQVYSLESDSWNCMDGPFSYSFDICRITRYGPGIGLFFHGALHWIGKSLKTSCEVIVSFDMSTETLTDMPLLKYPPDGWVELEKHLGVLGDCLCLAVAVRGVRFDVWVMQDYGAGESWTKKFTITHDQVPVPRHSFFKPIRSFENGEILIDTLDNLLLYNQINGSVRIIDFPDNVKTKKSAILYVNGENHVESLVSLKSGTYVEKRIKTVDEEEPESEKGRIIIFTGL